MTIGAILFEIYHKRKFIGSSRLRGWNLMKYWKEMKPYKQGHKYDGLYFQKTYWQGHMVTLQEVFKGPKVLDICDPDYLSITYEIVRKLPYFDAITCPTKRLRDDLIQMTNKPVYIIPDRQDLEYFKKIKNHSGRAEKVVWFGYSHNAKVLDPCIPFLRKYKLKLIVISDNRREYKYADKFIKWDIETVNDEILKGDIVLMPETNLPLHEYKSDNKITHSWALGMPVARTPEELIRFLDPEERQKEGREKRKLVEERYDIRQSVIELKKIFNYLLNKKNEKRNNKIKKTRD